MNLSETELTLGLPGHKSSGTKRGFSERVDLKLGSSSVVESGDQVFRNDESENKVFKAAKRPTSKAQVVGWPPVRSYRKNVMKRSCKYVKVAVDGAPYLRKVDLGMYNSYQQLLTSLEEMFTCLTIHNNLNERKFVDLSGSDYVPTYEDKDGDWMLVGDVPWEMFAESCKRLRLMKSSEAIGLAPRTPSKCSSTN
ncbi:hypothetical protein NMG60_11002632 [Bertholletia excelsa]